VGTRRWDQFREAGSRPGGAASPRGVLPVGADESVARVGQLLEELDKKLDSGEDLRVGVEIVAVGLSEAVLDPDEPFPVADAPGDRRCLFQRPSGDGPGCGRVAPARRRGQLSAVPAARRRPSLLYVSDGSCKALQGDPRENGDSTRAGPCRVPRPPALLSSSTAWSPSAG